MTQATLWAPSWPEGLHEILDYITAEEEAELVAEIDAAPWLDLATRRYQQYGWDYRDVAIQIDPFPEWAQRLGQRLVQDGIMEMPDNMIVNEYGSGQGINPHADFDWFGEVVANISLLDTWGLDVSRLGEVVVVPMTRRGCMVMSGESRYRWEHSIVARKNDILNGTLKRRGPRRLSVTFRTIPEKSVASVTTPC